MNSVSVKAKSQDISGKIKLDGSKSISNRALIIRALTENPFHIRNLSTSDDVVRMQQILSSENNIKDTGPAGTTFRFCTAYFAFQSGTQILTGTERMKQRPIGPLVNALTTLGANIEYMEKEGFPPLKIHEPEQQKTNKISIPADTSSHFITALLLLAPSLEHGLEVELLGEIVSKSYIQMTINLMKYFEADITWENQMISVKPKAYVAKDYTVEADWSAASYYYSIGVLANSIHLQLDGLKDWNLQGDQAIADISKLFGVESTFNDSGVLLSKTASVQPTLVDWNFILCPDIAQTVAVMCAATDTKGLFTGLQTLSIKETDRIQALKNELVKFGVYFSKLPPHFSPETHTEYFLIDGTSQLASIDELCFPTYHDHRMAMAFAPLALKREITIEDPMVVIKSYPKFWEDLKSIGFTVT